MNVQYMVSLMATLGIGEAVETSDFEKQALQYLNLAHNKLYRATSYLNQEIIAFLYGKQSTTYNNFNVVKLDQTPFLVSNVYVVQENSKPLISKSNDDFFGIVSTVKNQGIVPNFYTKNGEYIYFFPYEYGKIYNFNIAYVPQPKQLLINTQENQIPYPVSFHEVLVSGALYYMFQSEGGFKSPSRELQAMKDWENGKIEMIAYMQGSDTQRISTFCNV